jgi:hypothetical protein
MTQAAVDAWEYVGALAFLEAYVPLTFALLPEFATFLIWAKILSLSIPSGIKIRLSR